MKKIILLLAVITALFSSSCNENTDLDPTTPIYQHYEVDFYKDNAVAMANFHKHTAQGSLVELNNGASIKVNNTPMSFYGTGNSEAYLTMPHIQSNPMRLHSLSKEVTATLTQTLCIAPMYRLSASPKN